MQTESALGLHAFSVWIRDAGGLMDRGWIHRALFWLWLYYSWLKCWAEEIGILLSMRE